MSTILLALGLVMIVEGLAFALAPSPIERVLEMLRTLPEQAVRQIGLLIVVTDFILVWLAWHLGGL